MAIVVAILCLLLGVGSAKAQVVTVPTFSAGSATSDDWQILYTDVAADSGGNMLFFWSEVTSLGGTQLGRTLVSRHGLGGAFGPYVRSEDGRDFVLITRVDPRPYEGFVSAWTFRRSKGDSPLELRARYLDPSGTPHGPTFRVDSTGLTAVFGFAAAGLETGAAFAWWPIAGPGHLAPIHVQLANPQGQPRIGELVLGAPSYYPDVDMAALPGGGFVVGWGANADHTPETTSLISVHTENGQAVAPPVVVSTLSEFERLAVSAAGDVIAVLGSRPLGQSDPPTEFWVQRLTRDGVPLGGEIAVVSGASGLTGDVEFDLNGNLYVVWTESGVSGAHARGFDTSGAPIGPAVVIGGSANYAPKVVRLPDGSFLNGLGSYGSSNFAANVTSLCVPGSAVCGDGAVDAFCEQCDAGLGNSDAAPDACRTTCRPAACGDGVVDTGESCDDGNRTSCDGCSRTCHPEAGFGCGDGVPFPACGELCDDGNAVDGDGCTIGCTLERAPGGGGPTHDCYTEWSIDNAANEPRFDKYGNISTEQRCPDGDPRCDLDGSVSGSCTFGVRICANNTNLARCTPGTRLLSWQLRAPSEGRAGADPAAAAVRDALVPAVTASLVGPDARDFCTAVLPVPVPLRIRASTSSPGKVALKTIATTYDGSTDADKLRLVCLPPTP